MSKLDNFLDLLSRSCVDVFYRKEDKPFLQNDNRNFLKMRELAIEVGAPKEGVFAGLVGNDIHIQLTEKRIRLLLSFISAVGKY